MPLLPFPACDASRLRRASAPVDRLLQKCSMLSKDTQAGSEGPVCFSQGLVDRLHSVLRPFLLRRLKSEVEKQMPGKHEHVIKCRLSKRQRTLYEDYMASSETRSMLSSGNFLGIINVLMQLRKASGCRPSSFPLHHGACQTLHEWQELLSHKQLLLQLDT